MALTIGRRGAPALCILGRPYSLGGTASVLHMIFLVSLGNVYEQTDGVAMGSPLSPVIANFFLERFEQCVLESARLKPKPQLSTLVGLCQFCSWGPRLGWLYLCVISFGVLMLVRQLYLPLCILVESMYLWMSLILFLLPGCCRIFGSLWKAIALKGF